jgi:thymidine phosphorylase
MLVVSGLAVSLPDAHVKLEQALGSGRAAEIFGRMVHGLGGPADFVENPERHLATAAVEREVKSERGGFVTEMDTRDLGLAVVALGGGRSRVEDTIDHSVGIVFQAALGDTIEPGQTLAIVHAGDSTRAEAAARTILEHIHIGPVAPAASGAIIETIS